MEEQEIKEINNQLRSGCGFEEVSGSGSGSEWNQEKAIVLYKKPENPHQFVLYSPYSNFSVSVDSDLISDFKNQFIRSRRSGVTIKPAEEEEEEAASSERRSSMAVVPWVPYNPSFGEAETMMETEQDGIETMDIEDNTAESSSSRGSIEQEQEQEQGNWQGNGFDLAKGLPQWQQQHCFIPNLPYTTSTTTSTPISWSHC
ncbi:uncharacterized protein LOC125369357 isoform X2 [Ricinus communis]|nr:uncharacterized protein LOC125369357 isoform X2 [Ricinus communis]